jgi:hypothetical protein
MAYLRTSEIKDSSLTGILVLKRMGETLVSFYDSGNFLEEISFEGEKEVSASSRVRPYSYSHNIPDTQGW